MTLEEAIGELDTWVNFTNEVTKQVFPSGLTLHYSTSKKEWQCFYGKKSASTKHRGIGKTPLEAVQDKIRQVETLN